MNNKGLLLIFYLSISHVSGKLYCMEQLAIHNNSSNEIRLQNKNNNIVSNFLSTCELEKKKIIEYLKKAKNFGEEYYLEMLQATIKRSKKQSDKQLENESFEEKNEIKKGQMNKIKEILIMMHSMINTKKNNGNESVYKEVSISEDLEQTHAMGDLFLHIEKNIQNEEFDTICSDLINFEIEKCSQFFNTAYKSMIIALLKNAGKIKKQKNNIAPYAEMENILDKMKKETTDAREYANSYSHNELFSKIDRLVEIQKNKFKIEDFEDMIIDLKSEKELLKKNVSQYKKDIAIIAQGFEKIKNETHIKKDRSFDHTNSIKNLNISENKNAVYRTQSSPNFKRNAIIVEEGPGNLYLNNKHATAFIKRNNGKRGAINEKTFEKTYTSLNINENSETEA